MNIVMFTPAARDSAIGYVAYLVCEELVSKGHQVTIVRSEEESLLERSTHEYKAEMIPWNDPLPVHLAVLAADTVIYHIGNSYLYHKGCIVWLPNYPGVICLHDFVLSSLFHDSINGNFEEARRVLQHWYGNAIKEHFFSFNDFPEFLEYTASQCPMTEWVCSMGNGVVVHSAWGVQRVLDACPGPVYAVPLAYDIQEDSVNTDYDNVTDDFVILTVGYIGVNKRVSSVITALGKSSYLRKKITYRLVGQIESDYARELHELAKKHGVNLLISGRASDAEFTQALAGAKIILCLRWPLVEAASATAIMAMLSGKATVVTNGGFYSEIPDDCVIKIDHNKEIENIRSALEILYGNEEIRFRMGEAAQEWASKTFSISNYADKLIEISKAVNKAKLILDPIRVRSKMMAEWGASKRITKLKETIEPMQWLEKCNE